MGIKKICTNYKKFDRINNQYPNLIKNIGVGYVNTCLVEIEDKIKISK